MRHSQNFDFLGLNYWILKLLGATYKSDVWEPNYAWLFYYFNFQRSCDVLKLRSPYIKLNIKIKPKRNRKWKILHRVLERQTLCFSSYRNCKLKVRLWWVRAHEKRGYFLYRLFCPKGIFLRFVFYLHV